jgi:tetratricopeptide (TPR) repeat protein
MKLSSNERKQLLKVIIDSYPDITDLNMFVKLELGENLDNIVGGNNNTQKVFKLIEWAENRGKLKDLLNAISQDRPENLDLQNTIKNLQEKYYQNNQNNKTSQKKNKLSLFIQSGLSMAIIISSIIGYKIFSQPNLNCNDRQSQNQSDGIKIIIPDFEGNQDPNLKTYLFEKLKTKIPPNVTICQVNQEIKDSFAASKLRKKLFDQNSNSVLVIWGNMSEFDFLGGIKFIHDNSDDITLHIPLHQKDKLMFKDSLLKMLDIQINYGISFMLFRKNKDWKSQSLLEDTLGRIIDCQVKNEKVIINDQEELLEINRQKISKSYDLLGDFYQNNKNFDKAIESYKCSFYIQKDRNQRNFLLLKQAENYNQKNNVNEALLLYQKVIDNGSNSLKTRALVSRAIMFADRGECSKAEYDLVRVINENSGSPYGFNMRSNMRFFQCPNRLNAIADLSEFCRLTDTESCQNKIAFYYQVITQYDREEYQKIISELREIHQAHPEWQRLINPLIKRDH